MPVGQPFRDDDWSQAKNQALENLTEARYPAAKISHSEAKIQDQYADLSLELDSGPAFFIGDMKVDGLSKYPYWLVERYHPPTKGEPYSRDRLLKFQREMQNSPYFSSVTVGIDPDPAVATAVPFDVVVKERPARDFGLGAGISSNTGARGELSYRDRDFTGRAFDLRSVLRIEQLRQIGYVDIYLPPRTSGYLDSFGVLFDRTNISGLQTTTSSFGAKRVIVEDQTERRFGLSFINEKKSVNGEDNADARALVGSVGWTWRAVDNSFAPRNGSITQADISGADRGLLSDQRFLRLYGKYQYWLPVRKRDGFIFRAELGDVLSTTSTGIPEDYLFRAGGTSSVRGYAYQSIGIAQNNGVVGARVLATASVEYVHWVGENWGVAGFFDAGDAADRIQDLRLKQGIGLGGRYKTPAGPIALDLGFNRETGQARLDFSIGIAF
jgi:translocation and assembly module TamA